MQQQERKKKVDPGECKLCGGHLSGNKSSFNCTTAQCVCVCASVACDQPSPCVTVCLCLCACAGEEKKTNERRHQCLSSDHSHYIISAWVTNNTDSVSTLSVENKDQHVQGEFLKARASLGHELKAIIELYVDGCFISSLFKIPPVF